MSVLAGKGTGKGQRGDLIEVGFLKLSNKFHTRDPAQTNPTRGWDPGPPRDPLCVRLPFFSLPCPSRQRLPFPSLSLSSLACPFPSPAPAPLYFPRRGTRVRVGISTSTCILFSLALHSRLSALTFHFQYACSRVLAQCSGAPQLPFGNVRGSSAQFT